MKKEKSQTAKIIDGFVTAVVVITAATLISSGISISRINTEYLETGVRAAKIVAERDSRQIFLSDSEAVIFSADNKYDKVDKILTFLPPPVNTVYLTIKEFCEQ